MITWFLWHSTLGVLCCYVGVLLKLIGFSIILEWLLFWAMRVWFGLLCGGTSFQYGKPTIICIFVSGMGLNYWITDFVIKYVENSTYVIYLFYDTAFSLFWGVLTAVLFGGLVELSTRAVLECMVWDHFMLSPPGPGCAF